MKESNENKESESVKADEVKETEKTEKTEKTKAENSSKDATIDQAKKVGEDVLATSKDIWSKLKPKLKTACEKVGKEASYQVNNENSVTRRMSEKAYQSAKSTVDFAKQKIKEKQAAKKSVAPEQKPAKKETKENKEDE